MAAGPVAGLAAGAAKKAVGPLISKAKSALGALRKVDVPNAKTLPGPKVPEYHLGNFTDGVAINRQVSGDEISYKYYGKSNRLGQTHNYVTKKQYSSEEELSNDLAILDKWGIEIDHVTTFQSPKGT